MTRLWKTAAVGCGLSVGLAFASVFAWIWTGDGKFGWQVPTFAMLTILLGAGAMLGQDAACDRRKRDLDRIADELSERESRVRDREYLARLDAYRTNAAVEFARAASAGHDATCNCDACGWKRRHDDE